MLQRIIILFLLTLALLPTFDLQAGTVQLPATGQATCYNTAGTVIPCAGTGQDGAIQAGMSWPNPRFTDNSNGTVTDNLTGVVWLKKANCTDTVGGVNKASGYLTWANALTWSNDLASGKCGLTDGSSAGQWRLPNIIELESLVDVQRSDPALPTGHPFNAVQGSGYWSSSSYANGTGLAWFVYMNSGGVGYGDGGSNGGFYVWPVRGGQ